MKVPMNPSTLELFKKQLERLTEMVVLGKAHIKIGRGLSQALYEDPAILHVAPVFWGMTQTAHLDIAQLIAFKLFDPQSNALTVEDLLSRAEELRTSFAHGTPSQVEAVVKVARSQIASLAPQLKKIRAKRSRVLAHLDRTVIDNPEKLARAVALTFSDLNLIFNTAGNILNEVSVKFRDASTLYDLIDSEDYESAVGLIADAKCAQVRQYEEEFGHWDGPRPRRCSEGIEKPKS